MSACRSCGAEIEWATTAAGKAMPLDVAPSPTGNLVIGGVGPSGPIVRAWLVGEDGTRTSFAFCDVSRT